jgi:hypothetical protein
VFTDPRVQQKLLALAEGFVAAVELIAVSLKEIAEDSHDRLDRGRRIVNPFYVRKTKKTKKQKGLSDAPSR